MEGSCTTTDGACSVTWRSQGSAPANGRVTVLATAIGEESYTDVNANGVFDSGDSFTDIPEAFRDDNENGTYDGAATDGFFLDFDQDGAYDAADGLFNGLLCQHPTLCSTRNSVAVNDSILVIKSGPAVNITPSTGTLTAPGTVTFTLSDANGNPPPNDATVSVSTTNGQLLFGASGNVGCAFAPVVWPVSVASDGTASSGTLTITVTTARGIATAATITVND